MPEITTRCTNADEMRLLVTAEFTLREWRKIMQHIDAAPYYAPLHDIHMAIEGAIRMIEQRAVVQFSDPEGGQS